MHIIVMVSAAILSAVVLEDFGGIVVGAAIGYLLAEVVQLRRRLARLEHAPAATDGVAKPATRTAPAATSDWPAAKPQPDVAPVQPAAPSARPADRVTTPSRAVPRDPPVQRTVRTDTASAPNALQRFMTDGNWAVRLGIVILFFGVAFLLKYAAEHVYVPIQARLIGVAIGSLVLLALGWRLRHRREAYALALQGGGIGVLYLNLFAALRLYQLIPASAAFAMLAAIGVFSAALAVMQNARSLAILGMAGGFLAPILTSTGSGSHVMLFSYYALLNAGVVGIAWFRAWRELNLLGFAFTFVIASTWGYLSYRPEHFASTEPFLILFFAFYLAVAVLFALRQPEHRRGFIDGTLVFGTPIVAFGLQAALMHDIERGLGWSALVLAAVYLSAASLLWRGRIAHRRFLVEAFFALGVIFLTLTFPLMLDSHWTSAAWAIEGAGVAWVGIRQKRLLMQAFGVLVQVAAGVAFFIGETPDQAMPLANRFFIGGALLATVGLFTSYVLQRQSPAPARRETAALLFVWGMAWWFGTLWVEVQQQAPVLYRIAIHVAVTAASALFAALLAQRLSWRWLWWPALALLPVLYPYSVWAWSAHGHVWAYGGVIAWPLALGVGVWILHRAELQRMPVSLLHAAIVWLVAGIATVELVWLAEKQGLRGAWFSAAIAVPALFISYVVAHVARRPHWPFATQRHAYLQWGLAPLIAGLLLWSLASNLHAGGSTPLLYMPIMNPLDVVNLLAFIVAVHWLTVLKPNFDADTRNFLAWSFGAAVFLWANAVLLRSLHHYADIPYRFDMLSESVMVQAALSLFWSVCALVAMLAGRHRHWRPIWLAGAVLLAVVVVKLFAVDLSNTGTVARIVSFLGVGVLLLLIGYVAPVPPRLAQDTR